MVREMVPLPTAFFRASVVTTESKISSVLDLVARHGHLRNSLGGLLLAVGTWTGTRPSAAPGLFTGPLRQVRSLPLPSPHDLPEFLFPPSTSLPQSACARECRKGCPG